ncbi:hypothetical protein D5S18_00965 [Nocardia panacis]|uniref:ABC transmembrane type-1 domain-containing protein n=1 Tax=Nocardia panacis TaxID=2340916 RepID=A0A3A4L0F0_9NOCA|nr:hypothetical protein [Nocardia panacis]RJO79875.1 hypothetical protein D5S18_00965 [Nocardia panacis]
MTPVEFEAGGLIIELAPRRMSGPLVPGWNLWGRLVWVLLLPAAALTAVLVVPAAATVVEAARARWVVVLWCAVVLAAAVVARGLWSRYAAQILRHKAIAVGLFSLPGVVAIGTLAAILGADGFLAYARTTAGVVVAVAVLGLALLAARRLRRTWIPWWPLIVPFGVAAFVAGLAFRLIFELPIDVANDIVAQNFRVQAQWLLYAILLGAAFGWTWAGALFVLLRTAIGEIEADPVQSAHVRGPDGRPTLRGLYTLLRPMLWVFGLVVGVAAARLFDVVLIAVPGSRQYVLDSATVHWWRMTTDGADPGAAAAFSLPLAVLIGVAAWLSQSPGRGAARPEPLTRPVPVRIRLEPTASRAGRLLSGARPLLRVTLVALAFLAPIVVLVVVGWIGFDGSAFDGPFAIWHDQEIWRSLRKTAVVAVIATCLLLTAALPAAYYTAALRPEHTPARIAVTFLIVLTVLPAQLYVGPIHTAIEHLGLTGTSLPLIVTHAAIGLPISTLILRGALLAPAATAEPEAPRGRALRRIRTTAARAVGAVAVLELVQVWNDFFVGLLVSGADLSPWSLLLWGEARQFNEGAAHLAAGALLCAAPPVLLVLLTWRRLLVPGLTGGVLR